MEMGDAFVERRTGRTERERERESVVFITSSELHEEIAGLGAEDAEDCSSGRRRGQETSIVTQSETGEAIAMDVFQPTRVQDRGKPRKKDTSRDKPKKTQERQKERRNLIRMMMTMRRDRKKEFSLPVRSSLIRNVDSRIREARWIAR